MEGWSLVARPLPPVAVESRGLRTGVPEPGSQYRGLSTGVSVPGFDGEHAAA